MTDIRAVVRVEHPDIVLTGAVSHDTSAVVRSVSEAGTDPTSGRFFYRVVSSDLGRFEAGLCEDHTIRAFDRVRDTGEGEAVYSVEYAETATVLSPVVSTARGVVLDMGNEGSAWDLTVWMPDRASLARLWDHARSNGIDIELLRVNEYATLDDGTGLTDSQREALLVAFETGYFEEPRDVTLGEVAADLGISQPAASGLLRRAIRRLVVSALLDDDRTEA
jgi:predicted DNA binding protein